MRLIINGEETPIPGDEITVAALIDRLGVGAKACAVEINRELAPRREHDTRTLRDGDEVEIVTLVGGG
ncbi:MAG: sulfur carrier protein ThiS [Phycisphaerales bacterium]|nr:MAG: sulfur carrier protein ThiS [Phycisphaerales bacterium]